MRNKLLKTIFIGLAFISSAAADESISYNLAGVRLGFSAAQAIEAMQSHFKIKNNQLILSPAITDPITGTSMSKAMEYSTPEESIFVGLELANPEEVQPELVVAFINYKSKETGKGSVNFAIKKFGEPSDTSMISAGIYLWCAQPVHDRCDWSKQNLSYNNKELTLTDPIITQNYFEIMVRKSASNNGKSHIR
jgi:hypothetical protein